MPLRAYCFRTNPDTGTESFNRVLIGIGFGSRPALVADRYQEVADRRFHSLMEIVAVRLHEAKRNRRGNLSVLVRRGIIQCSSEC